MGGWWKKSKAEEEEAGPVGVAGPVVVEKAAGKAQERPLGAKEERKEKGNRKERRAAARMRPGRTR